MVRPLRVLVTSGIFPPDVGGPATHAAALFEELPRRGHVVNVISLHDGRRRLETDGVVRYPRAVPWPIRTLGIARRIWRTRSQYDVVYATGLHLPAVLGSRLARRPVVLKVVGDHAWERGRRRGLTDAGFEDFQSAAPRGRLGMMRRARDWAIRNADQVTVPSEYLRRVVEGWLDGAKVPTVIPNRVRAPRRLSRSLGASDTRLRTVFVGRLVPHKRVEVLIEAVAGAAEVSMQIIGEGPEDAALRRLVNELACQDRVIFSGSLPHEQVLQALVDADALLLASEYEGLPHVAVEALACGTPVVSPDVGGVREVVRPDVNGILLESVDPASYGAVLGCLQARPELRAQLRAGAVEDAPRLHFERSLEQIETLLRVTVAARPRVVLFGRARIATPIGPTTAQKLRVFDDLLDTVVVGSGAGAAKRVGNVRVIPVPASTISGLGMVAFYGIGSVLAVGLAGTRRPSAIVCQSPFEGIACLAMRQLIPPRFRPLVVVEAHGDWKASTRLYGSAIRRGMAPLADWAARHAIRHADRVRVVGTALEREARAVGYRGEVDRFPTFSDFAAFLGRPPAPFPSRPRAIFVGGLVEPKGLDVLLEGWPRVSRAMPDATLTLVGDGPLRAELSTRADELGVAPSVSFVGALPPARLPLEIDGSSCLVLPSRSEGLGRVILEALARGRPVIATAVGGIPDIVVDGETGILVQPEDSEALAAALVELLSDAQRLRRMGSAGRAWVESRNPVEEYRAGVARLAEWLADSSPGRV